MAVPVLAGERQRIIDMLRGWALIGVVIMNYLDYMKLGPGAPMADSIIFGVVYLLFKVKSWMLLSFLFGYGFSIQMRRRAGEPGADVFFLRRMGVLLLISFINILFFSGDILHDYALLGVALLLLSKLPLRVVFWTSILLLVAPIPLGFLFPGALAGQASWSTASTWSTYMGHDLLAILKLNLRECRDIFISMHYGINVHVIMLSMMLLGLYAERKAFFVRLADLLLRKRLFWSSFVAMLLGIGWVVVGGMFLPESSLGYTSTFLVQGAAGLFFFMALVRLWHGGKLKRFFHSLSIMGRMTLTNYLVQNLLMIPLFSGVGLGWAQRSLSWPYIALALVVYIIQIRFSNWWLKRYIYGPVEWIWRCLSYGQRLPLKRGEN